MYKVGGGGYKEGGEGYKWQSYKCAQLVNHSCHCFSHCCHNSFVFHKILIRISTQPQQIQAYEIEKMTLIDYLNIILWAIIIIT